MVTASTGGPELGREAAQLGGGGGGGGGTRFAGRDTARPQPGHAEYLVTSAKQRSQTVAAPILVLPGTLHDHDGSRRPVFPAPVIARRRIKDDRQESEPAHSQNNRLNKKPQRGSSGADRLPRFGIDNVDTGRPHPEGPLSAPASYVIPEPRAHDCDAGRERGNSPADEYWCVHFITHRGR